MLLGAIQLGTSRKSKFELRAFLVGQLRAHPSTRHVRTLSAAFQSKIDRRNSVGTQSIWHGLVGGHFVITICRQTVGFVEGRSSFVQPSRDRMQRFPTQSSRLEQTKLLNRGMYRLALVPSKLHPRLCALFRAMPKLFCAFDSAPRSWPAENRLDRACSKRCPGLHDASSPQRRP